MRPVSGAYLRTIRGSHKVVSRAKVLDTYQTGVTPIGDEIPIINGDVTSDANADVRSTLDLSTVGKVNQDGLLSPYGNEIFVERGVYFSDNSLEWVSLGYFRIETVNKSDILTGDLRIVGKDRMSQIIDERLPFSRTFAANTFIEDIFNNLLQEVYPSAVLEFDHTPGSLSITRPATVERDRYKFLKNLATARGKIFYWDHRGVPVLKDPPDISDPVFTVNYGKDGVLMKAAHEMSRENVYNGVVAFGEGTDMNPPVSALVIDRNPTSKTYWYGSFGKVPRFYFSTFITTKTQAISAATKILRDALGLPYRVDFSMVPNVALEVRDPIVITSPNQSNRTQALQTLRVPLAAEGEMTATTKEKTGEEIEELQ